MMDYYTLICIVLILSLQPIIGYLLSIIITIAFSAIKELYDYFIQKDNNINQVKHDVICNSIGIIISSIIILLHNIIN